MQTSRIFLALIAAIGFAPLAATAQYYDTPPGYTFGGFPGMGGMFPGAGNFGAPRGFPGGGQSPFLTMPAPQYPFANPQFPEGGAGQPQAPAFPGTPMAQPLPYWMQTPRSPQEAPTRFIGNIPLNAVPQNTIPGYNQFAPQGFAPQVRPQMAPPRWAPLSGQLPSLPPPPRGGNFWSLTPFSGPNYAPALPSTPPKWPTP